MNNIYVADFVSHEEYLRCDIMQEKFISPTLYPILKVELLEYSSVIKAKLLYRHPSLTEIRLGDWTYLVNNDLRQIVPLIEFRQRNKPFYITFETVFYQAKDIFVNEENILEFVFQPVTGTNLN